MEERHRKPFEGIINIINFNRHFYIAALAAAIALPVIKPFVPGDVQQFILAALLLLIISTLFSLAVSFYVYDVSSLYTLTWLDSLPVPENARLVNINAGFEEASYLLAKKYPAAGLTVFDFYNPERHTEVSIGRARKRYAAYPGTISISTSHVPLPEQSADCMFAILSAHEIRNRQERVYFFKQIKAALKKGGHLVVAEHTRNASNFIAYNIGFFHFLSEKEWKHTFRLAGLCIDKEKRVTPFIHVFFLQKNEYSS